MTRPKLSLVISPSAADIDATTMASGTAIADLLISPAMWTEAATPKRMTPAAANKANAVFWDAQREPVESSQEPGVAALVREANRIETGVLHWQVRALTAREAERAKVEADKTIGNRKRAGVAAKAAAKARVAKGNATVARVVTAAAALLKRDPTLTRKEVAERIYASENLGIGIERIVALLKGKGLFPRRNRR